MSSTGESEPRCVLVTSAMRTGSTWLVRMLRDISQFPERHFVKSAGEVDALLEGGDKGGIIKSHAICDLDWPDLPARILVVRVTRNFKDSLISRVLYDKNIRPSEGRETGEREIREMVEKDGDVSDQEFVRRFVDRRNALKTWLAHIVVMERGRDERCLTLTYESLMHNPYDAMEELTGSLWPDWAEARSRVHATVQSSIRRGFKQRETFMRRQAVGVGGWENWLTREQSERLDALFRSFRRIAEAEKGLRWKQVVERYDEKRNESEGGKR